MVGAQNSVATVPLVSAKPKMAWASMKFINSPLITRLLPKSGPETLPKPCEKPLQTPICTMSRSRSLVLGCLWSTWSLNVTMTWNLELQRELEKTRGETAKCVADLQVKIDDLEATKESFLKGSSPVMTHSPRPGNWRPRWHQSRKNTNRGRTPSQHPQNPTREQND